MWISFLIFLCGGRGCYFLCGQKVTKEPPGPPSVSTFAERVLTSGLPRTPFYGGVSLWIAETFRRAKSSSVLLPGLRPYQFKTYRRTALPYTAWCLLTCLVRQVSGGLNLLTHKKVGATEMSLLRICFLRAQKGNEVSHKVLCQAFFQESGGRRWRR